MESQINTEVKKKLNLISKKQNTLPEEEKNLLLKCGLKKDRDPCTLMEKK